MACGYPFFRTYPHLLHTLTWFASRVTSIPISLTYALILLCAWTLWPVSMYVGLRWLDLERSQASWITLFSCFASTQFRFGFEWLNQAWVGPGLGPYCMAIVLFPLALGLGRQWLRYGRLLYPAVFGCWLCLWSHWVVGYVLVLTLVIDGLFNAKDLRSWQPLKRGTVWGALVLLKSLFFILPLVKDSATINRSIFEHQAYWDSYPVNEIFGALITGNLLDTTNSFPLITGCALAGFAWLVAKNQYRFFILLFAFWSIAFLGRSGLNPVTWVLPFSENIPFERFLFPVQWFSFCIAGLAAERLFKKWPKLTGSAAFAGLFPTLVSVLTLAWVDVPVLHKKSHQFSTLAAQYQSDDFQSGAIPSRTLLPFSDQVAYTGIAWHNIGLVNHVEHLGFLWHSMSWNSDFLYESDYRNPHIWQLWDIGWAIGPPSQWTFPWLVNLDSGLYRNHHQTSRYEIVNHQPFSPANSQEKKDTILSWIRTYRSDAKYMVIGIDSTMNGKGSILDISDISPEHQAVVALVEEPGLLIAKWTYHPNWHVSINGEPGLIHEVSPSFCGVVVENTGRHLIEFKYIPDPVYRRFFWTCLVDLGFLALFIRPKVVYHQTIT